MRTEPFTERKRSPARPGYTQTVTSVQPSFSDWDTPAQLHSCGCWHPHLPELTSWISDHRHTHFFPVTLMHATKHIESKIVDAELLS